MESIKEPNKVHGKGSLRVLKWVIAIALVIVINLFFQYGIATIAPAPTFEGFCPTQQVNYVDAASCVQNGGQWTNYQLAPAGITTAVKNGQPIGQCDPNFTCQTNFNHAHSIYNRNVFIALIVLSLIVITMGMFLSVEALSLGFSFAGIMSLIIASIEYWSDANNWMRLVILFVALAFLIWIAIKKFRE